MPKSITSQEQANRFQRTRAVLIENCISSESSNKKIRPGSARLNLGLGLNVEDDWVEFWPRLCSDLRCLNWTGVIKCQIGLGQTIGWQLKRKPSKQPLPFLERKWWKIMAHVVVNPIIPHKNIYICIHIKSIAMLPYLKYYPHLCFCIHCWKRKKDSHQFIAMNNVNLPHACPIWKIKMYLNFFLSTFIFWIC